MALASLVLAIPMTLAAWSLLRAAIADQHLDHLLHSEPPADISAAPQLWAQAHQTALDSIAFYPVQSGAGYEQLGRTLQWQSAHYTLGNPKAKPIRDEALQAYRVAVSSRPTWPYNWVNLASIKLHLLQFDEEFDHAMQQAFEYGPWRSDINQGLAEIGFIAWPRLNADQRLSTLESARRVAATRNIRRTRDLLEAAQRSGRRAEFCQAVSGEAIGKRVCR